MGINIGSSTRVCLLERVSLPSAPCLPAHLSGLPAPAPAALVDICVDDQRHILYTRTQSSLLQVRLGRGIGDQFVVCQGCGGTGWRHLPSVGLTVLPHRKSPRLPPLPQVFDLGADGKAAPSKAAESTEFLQDAARALGGRDVFGRGGARWPLLLLAHFLQLLWFTLLLNFYSACCTIAVADPTCLHPGSAGGDRKGAAVVYMAPIPPSQSHRLHLLTVTADGRRVYWAAASSRYGSDRELTGLPACLPACICSCICACLHAPALSAVVATAAPLF